MEKPGLLFLTLWISFYLSYESVLRFFIELLSYAHQKNEFKVCDDKSWFFHVFNRLSYLTFDDLVFCAEQMLDHWTVGSVEGSSG